MAAKGGLVRDITPGDCMELLDCCRRVFSGGTRANRGSFLCQLLHSAGVFPPGAPATVRMISTRFAGQLSAEQLAGRRDLACRPVRDLLVDYLRERQPGIDCKTLTGLATTLALWFWKDLEAHHPGIDSLRLPPDIAAGWKKRIQTRPARTPGGAELAVSRETAGDILMTVRAFYLDLGQWALDEPARWGPRAVPCPVRGSDTQRGKRKSQTKARMDQRARERLPACPRSPRAQSILREVGHDHERRVRPPSPDAGTAPGRLPAGGAGPGGECVRAWTRASAGRAAGHHSWVVHS